MSAPSFLKSKIPQWNISPEFIAEHPELHHYTDQGGLQGIWNSQQLRAKHFSHLNDKLEIRALMKPLESLLIGKHRPIHLRKMRTSFKYRQVIDQRGGSAFSIEKEIKNFVSANFDASFFENDIVIAKPFFTSFCSHARSAPYTQQNGLLSQWRGYGGIGKFALVFDTNGLVDLLSREWRSHYWHMLKLNSVLYYHDNKNLEEKFPDLLEQMSSFLEIFLSPSKDQIKSEISPKFLEVFWSAATLLKHRGFEEEQEVRIVAMPSNEAFDVLEEKGKVASDDPPLKGEHTNDKNHRHIALFETLKSPLPITRIIVGPSENQAVDEAFVRHLTQGAVAITLSETPYNGP